MLNGLAPYLLSACEPVALLIALVVAIRMRLAYRWPSLIASLAGELSADSILLWLIHHPGHYDAYFCTYWISVFLQSIVRLWIIADVARSFPGLGFLPKRVYLFVGASGATMAVASAAHALHRSGLCPQMANLSIANASIHCLVMCLRSNASAAVILLDRCVNIAWAVFVLYLLASVKILGLGWSSMGARVANGVSARICCALVMAQIGSLDSARIHHYANSFDSLCSIAIFLFWSYSFSHTSQHPEHESGDNVYTQSSLSDLLAIRAGRER
jgi:hypothetical protein